MTQIRRILMAVSIGAKAKKKNKFDEAVAIDYRVCRFYENSIKVNGDLLKEESVHFYPIHVIRVQTSR
jgi:hypothetical protein